MKITKQNLIRVAVGLAVAAGAVVLSVPNANDIVLDGGRSYGTLTYSQVGTEADPVVIWGNGARVTCLRLTGRYIVARDFRVDGCSSHGVLITGKNIVFENSVVTNTVRENVDRSGGWGSGVKVQIGGENVTIRGNHVYENHGEGIAATRGRNVLIENNLVHDNFSVNLYLDNSPDTIARGNRVTNTGKTSFYRNGNPAQCVLLGTEVYSGWGNQFKNVLAEQNYLYNCYRGIRFYGEGGTTIPQGSNVRVVNNFFHNTTLPWVALPSSVLVSGNIAGTPPPDGVPTVTPAPPTMSRTPTVTRTQTRTPTSIPVSVTLPPSVTPIITICAAPELIYDGEFQLWLCK
jgi:parallel beta-helix repeat protein